MDIYLPKGDVLTKRPVIFSITVEPSTREINLAKTALISVVNLQKRLRCRVCKLSIVQSSFVFD